MYMYMHTYLSQESNGVHPSHIHVLSVCTCTCNNNYVHVQEHVHVRVSVLTNCVSGIVGDSFANHLHVAINVHVYPNWPGVNTQCWK